ncbi:molybdate transport system substrate-binding protein [Onishia taeanensis]|uniref:Molybdate transport system substrate-binding protein n=1 Tax=Onishia taeanensis TaxID=284577 RepID=A0A328XSN5_9GAMM|nr:molybdate ABC transporter substrate-binding protein [Halomonas taeanensis]RAR63022.1 molybdate transport system substrate-binding protein [Halomonas taeanensis]
MRVLSRQLAQWLLVLGLAVAPAVMAADVPRIAVASSLQFALTEIAKDFHNASGRQVILNMGSSGNFRRQIDQGAPFELFLSANEGYVQALHEAGKTRDAGVRYARGRLVWLQRKGLEEGREGEERPDSQMKEQSSSNAPLAAVKAAVQAWQADGSRARFALANPEHAPYGVAARQALAHEGLWDTSQPLQVQGENVAQAARFALSADTRGGLVAYSLACSPSLAGKSRYVLIPEAWHAPLHQRMALLPGAGETAEAFYAYLQSPPARQVFRDYGFAVPASDAP